MLCAAMLAALPVRAFGEDRPLPRDVGPVPGGNAYVIQSCGESGSVAGWSLNNGYPTTLDGGMTCAPVRGSHPRYPNSIIQSGLWLSDRLGEVDGLEAAEGSHAEMRFATIAGTTITRIRYYRQVRKYADDDWYPYIALAEGTVLDTCDLPPYSSCAVGGDSWYGNDPRPMDYNASFRDLTGVTTTGMTIGLSCRSNDAHICGNGMYLTSAEPAIYSAFFTISDPTPPSIGTPSGDGWSVDGWQHGTLPLSLTSSDNTGISATRVYADGSLIATLQGSCSYTKPRPCTDESSGAVGLPTAGLADGLHAIKLAAVNAAGTETTIERGHLLAVDHDPPAPPTAMAAPFRDNSENRFSASWSLPADSGAPIAAARYKLCQNDNCGATQTAPSLTAIPDLALPGTGTWDLCVWLVDEMGHENPVAATRSQYTYIPAPAAPSTSPSLPAPTPAPGLDPVPQPAPTKPPVATPTPRAASNLKITLVRRAGRRVTVAGRLTRKASGRIAIRYRVRRHGRLSTVSVRASIRRGAFRAALMLPRAIAAVARASITVSYAGDRDTAAGTRTTLLRVRK